MASDSEEEFDADEGFEADLESLKRAFILTGASPNHVEADLSRRDADTSVPCSPDADDAEDDIELVRDIQKRFSLSTDVQEPLYIEALCSIFPTASEGGDDCEDDLEALRAIQRRFASYNDDNAREESDKKLHRPVQVGVTNITSEKESCNNFFLERTNAGEGFPTSVDEHNSGLQISVACSDLGARPQSSLHVWNNGSTENASSSNFPKSAQAFVDAIKKNRAFQKFIRSKMIHIEARIEELKKLRARVKIFKDFQVCCKKRTGHALAQKKDARVQLISILRQKANDRKCSALYYAPPENPVVASYREALMKFPFSVNRERWSKEERENLLKGVKRQFQETMFHRSIDLRSDMDGSSGGMTDIDNNILSIRDLDITPEMMRLFLPKVNWGRLASMYIPRRTGAECQTRWLNWEDPLINQEPWDFVQEKNLLHIVQQKGLSNWIDIAISLGTNRTPFQCLARYQRSLNASILKREWTDEEDNKLRAAVETFGESNWQVVAASLEDRTGTQCSNRWIKTLHPARQKVGKWTADEDKRLKVAVMLFGRKIWKKIAQYVTGRTHVQCRERWVNNLDPALNLNEWTEEEDLKLEAAIAEHGYSWSKVASCVAPRTDSQCRRRWKVLYPHEVPLLRDARKLQKAAFISNFVDREAERPSLKPDDFSPAPLLLTVSQSKTRRKRKIAAPSHMSYSPIIATNSMEVGSHSDNITSNTGTIRKRPSKLPPRRKGKQGNCECNEDVLEDGMEVGSHSGNITSNTGSMRKRRSKLAPRRKGDEGNCERNEDVLEDGMEVGSHSGNITSNTGTMRKRPSKLAPRRKGKKGNCESNEDVLENGMEVGSDSGNITSNTGTMRKWPSKLAPRRKGKKGNCESNEDILEDGMEVGSQGGNITSNTGTMRKRRSKLAPRRKGEKGNGECNEDVLVDGMEVGCHSGNITSNTSTMCKRPTKLVPRRKGEKGNGECNEDVLVDGMEVGSHSGNITSNTGTMRKRPSKLAPRRKGEKGNGESNEDVLEDDVPLAHFFNKLKRRRLDPAIPGSN